MARERLDVEDEQGRAARLGNLFTSISNPAEEAAAMPMPFPQPPSRPFAMPESDVLARARAFLPLLAASNADLLTRAAENPDSVVIENPSANSDVVAMDVGLGVFDVQGSVGEGMGPVVERDAEVWARADVGEDDDDMDEDEDEDEDGADEENGEGKGEGEGEEKEKKDQEETSSTPTRKVVEI